MLKLLAPAAATIILAISAPVVVAPTTVGQADIASVGPVSIEPATPVAVEPAESPAAHDDHDHDIVDVDEQPSVSLRPTVDVVGANEDEQVAVDEALTRFRDAGLLLPDIQIVFHDDQSECKGYLGLFRRQFTPWRVLVCSDLAFVPTHELAHAWEAANLDGADRVRYTELRGLSTWDSADASWGERAVEDAAFMVQQNLMASRIDAESERWIERTDAYESLTGRPSPALAEAA